jgi:hypothetical protein
MANWLNHSSFVRRAPKLNRSQPVPCARWASLLWLALAATTGCGQAQTPERVSPPQAATPLPPAGTNPTTAAAEGADGTTLTTGDNSGDTASAALCKAADAGFLRARLQGALVAEIDWKAGHEPQCLGGPRPAGDGLRLLYKGASADGPLVVVIGIGGLEPGVSGRNVPANLTVILEGTGVFYATQGDDKCAFDSVHQEPLTARPLRFKLTGRGYCTQPARALGTAGAVLMSRFDVEAIIEGAEGTE